VVTERLWTSTETYAENWQTTWNLETNRENMDFWTDGLITHFQNNAMIMWPGENWICRRAELVRGDRRDRGGGHRRAGRAVVPQRRPRCGHADGAVPDEQQTRPPRARGTGVPQRLPMATGSPFSATTATAGPTS
jgi:hypothetical protein